MNKKEKAVSSFKSGLNCAQSVVSAYTEDLKIDAGLAASFSCAFGAGMGRLQGTCGAVTGAYMVLGIVNCRKYADNKDRKEKTYAQVQEYSRRFKAIYGTTDCRELLHCDLKTQEGQDYFHGNNLHEIICEKCVSDSVGIIDELIA